MSMYHCEGFVKEVKIDKDGKVTFTLDPAAPYIFEKKRDDGKAKRCMLLLEASKTSNKARILDGDDDPKFSVPSGCSFSAMVIVKANHLKVRVISRLSSAPIPVEGLTVL